MPKLSLLLSTIDDRIYQAEKIFSLPFESAEFVIVHQVTDASKSAQYEAFYEKFSSEQIRFLQRLERGTGRSRNLALSEAKGELFYICDDDIELLPDFYSIIKAAADKNSGGDILSFMIKDEKGKSYKNYFQEKKWLGLKDTAKISNVEIIIRQSWYVNHHVQFDERFGLGTIFNTGEEFIFLSDALKQNAKILFIPEYIAVHPRDSSGKRFSRELIEAKGAMIARVYGKKFWLVNFAFAIRKFGEYKSSISFISFLRFIYGGSFQFEKL